MVMFVERREVDVLARWQIGKLVCLAGGRWWDGII